MKEYKYKVNGVEYTVDVNSVQGNKAQVSVNGIAYDVEIENAEAVQAASSPAPLQTAQAAAPATPAAEVPQTEAPKTEAPKAAAPQAAAPAGGTPVKAPLPGVISDLKVAVGEKVSTDDRSDLKPMKMENEITAETSGTVTSIAVIKGTRHGRSRTAAYG